MIDPAYLLPSRFVESDDPAIVAFSDEHSSCAADPVETVRSLYLAVRDRIIYDPYQKYARLETYSARSALLRGRGYCVAKASLLAACCRAKGIPARLGFADVKNHLATPRLMEINGGDTFYFHAYTDIWIGGNFLKATPAFNLSMCEKFGIFPLEFDGSSDSILQPYNLKNERHMEYLLDRGTFSDVPVDLILEAFSKYCPRYLENDAFGCKDFNAEISVVKR